MLGPSTKAMKYIDPRATCLAASLHSLVKRAPNSDHVDAFHGAWRFALCITYFAVLAWFLWVSDFKEADRQKLRVGKVFHAIYSIPVLGDYVMPLTVTELEKGKSLVIESDSLLKPK
ncbi:unnamed protein product [Cyprideis torosa]|uniref:Uncharacterized protein n=1 Tax=Cyprideis torosa TaxID=163714 RepID=A0A7R8ZGS1_9CRUS|nr:unnamed protein product [Cyprideis torosa]CAG0882062.1 unnamed protein product [Cyprideis torosa]